jgi:cytochrome c nitrite reductase small subunit
MNRVRTWTVIKVIALACIAGAAVMVFLMFGPPKLLAKSESPDFCSKCHVMGPQYEAWSHMGAHRRKLCVDCHLPNGNTGIHYIWKALDGLKDVVFFYSGSVPERIRLTAHGEKVLQANCIRCHESTVEFINHERKCWECHRRLIHTRSGSMETI